MADIMYQGTSQPTRRMTRTTERAGAVRTGMRVPTAKGPGGKIHLLMGVDGSLACGATARPSFRGVEWRAPEDLTCPICSHILEGGSRAAANN